MSISTIANYLSGRAQKSSGSQKRERQDDFFAKAAARGVKESTVTPSQEEAAPTHRRLSDAYRVTISAAALAKLNVVAAV
ncbi:MAG: hypothetical protein HQL66_07860 [Magnetococcales bacterium]|nr:hypothetical protein [Magnetococcales bacterium]